MTRISPQGLNAAPTWTVRCGAHSDPDIGVQVFACGVPEPRRPGCPCEIGDRYVVVDAVRTDFRWRLCADVLVCAPQSDLSAAWQATGETLARLPGCILAVASVRDSGSVLRMREATMLMPGHRPDPAMFAAFAHLRQFRDDTG